MIFRLGAMTPTQYQRVNDLFLVANQREDGALDGFLKYALPLVPMVATFDYNDVEDWVIIELHNGYSWLGTRLDLFNELMQANRELLVRMFLG